MIMLANHSAIGWCKPTPASTSKSTRAKGTAAIGKGTAGESEGMPSGEGKKCRIKNHRTINHKKTSMTIAIASDHAGFRYKTLIAEHLTQLGHTVVDFGTDSDHPPVDYPMFIRPAAQAVADGACDLGVVLGGSGNGEAIVANKVSGIRCGVCWNAESARLARAHNNANVISIGERMMPPETAIQIVDTWLNTPFEAGRHQQRIEQIEQV